MSEYLERIQQTFNEITNEDYSGKIWAKVYKKDNVSFRAKVQGVKSFIPFEQMPWEYKNTAHWDVVSHLLMGKAYDAKLISSDMDSNRLNLSVSHQLFPEKKYTKGQSYKCIVQEKHKAFLVVEAGSLFPICHMLCGAELRRKV